MINVDMRPVESEDEGLALMLHHLDMAAAYFEATPTNLNGRIIADRFSLPAIRAWITQMEALYPDD